MTFEAVDLRVGVMTSDYPPFPFPYLAKPLTLGVAGDGVLRFQAAPAVAPGTAHRPLVFNLLLNDF